MAAIAFEGSGTQGPPVVLVHGFPFDRRLWREQVAALGSVARVVAIDLPGFGGSHAPAAEVCTMEEMADAVVEVADGLGWDKFVVGGLSMGGYVALAAARKHRARLRALILCDTKAEADAPATQEARRADADRALREGVDFFVPRMLPRLVSREDSAGLVETMMREVRPDSFAAAQRGMAVRPDARPELAGLGLPALVVGGTEDALTPPDAMRTLAAAIPGAELALVPGGHVAPLESPAEVNAAVARFLKRL